MASVKVLAVGSANGDLATLVSKVTTIHSKHGPFDMLFCTGNFFGTETSDELVSDLLAGKFDFPMTTYFIHGSSGVPERVEQRALSNGGEVCPNLFYLGSHGVMTSAEGAKFASLSGQYDRQVYEADTEAEDFDVTLLKTRYTAADVEHLVTSAKPKAVSARIGVDVFLSYEWPMGIMNGLVSQDGNGGTPAPVPPALASVPASAFSYPLAKLTAQLQPRYHFAASAKTFWERPPYRNTEGAGFATRFIGLADVANPQKQRWFYAFNLVPLAKAGDDVLQASLTANTTDSPFAVAGLKRGRPAGQDDEQNFFWGTQGQGQGQKRSRGGPGQGQGSQEPPPGYVCKRCNTPGHFIRDCTQARAPPEGYVCNICKEPGHFIADCTQKASVEKAREEERAQRNLQQQQHQQKRQQQRGPPGTTASPCWFCLSNPEVDKNLILSIGTEVYMTMAKGQLPSTPSSLVPGGGHVLLIAINHASNFGSVEEAAREQVHDDIAAYKQGLKKLYASKGAGMISWELSLGGKIHHAHLQICPVPKDKLDEVERAFEQGLGELLLPNNRPQQPQEQEQQQQQQQQQTDQQQQAQDEEAELAWQDHAPQDPQQGFFRVELPSGRTLVCPLPRTRRANAQFGRNVVASALGLKSRSNWKSCMRLADDELADSNTFKAAFKDYDFTLA
ncbi:hypothetical protein DFQ26_004506 [Actinomortierella ambigua]|nr:hypothetical protein DFQ26_004506 [Actinomortierella ambigua]